MNRSIYPFHYKSLHLLLICHERMNCNAKCKHNAVAKDADTILKQMAKSAGMFSFYKQ